MVFSEYHSENTEWYSLNGLLSPSGVIAAIFHSPLGAEEASLLPTNQQRRQLFLLLNHTLKRAAELGIPSLLSFGHLLRAKFYLEHLMQTSATPGIDSDASEAYPNSNGISSSVGALEAYRSLHLPLHVLNASASSALLLPSGLCPSPMQAWYTARHPPGAPHALACDVPSLRDLNLSTAFQTTRGAPVDVSSSRLAERAGAVGSAILLQATAWQTYGVPAMAGACALSHALNFGESAASEDRWCSVLKLVSLNAAERGPRAGLEALERVRAHWEKTNDMTVKACRSRLASLGLELSQDALLGGGCAKDALAVCHKLALCASPSRGCDTELKAEASIRKAKALAGMGRFKEAVQVAKKLFVVAHRGDLQLLHAKVLLLLAEIHQKAGSSLSALPFALSCLKHAQTLHCDGLAAVAGLRVAQLRCSPGASNVEGALGNLVEVMPLVMGHCMVVHQAEALNLLAICLKDVGQPVTAGPQTEYLESLLLQAAAKYEAAGYLEKQVEVQRLARTSTPTSKNNSTS